MFHLYSEQVSNSACYTPDETAFSTTRLLFVQCETHFLNKIEHLNLERYLKSILGKNSERNEIIL